MVRRCSLLVSLMFVFLVVALTSSVGQTKNASGTGKPSATTPTTNTVEDEDEDSPDIPTFAQGRLSEKDYLTLRDEQLRLQRGIDDLLRDPQARSRAIRKMVIQEKARRSLKTGAARFAIIPASIPTWVSLGPSPIPNGQTITNTVPVSGRVTAIVIDPSDSTGNTVYVGAAQGGVYRTQDGGATWTALMDSAQSLAIGALALDPTDPTTLFVGTGEGNLSLDSFFGVGVYIISGANSNSPSLTGPFNTPTVSPDSDGFTDVFTGRAITKILVNPNNHNQILVSTSSGFSGASGDINGTLPTRGVYLSTNALSGSPTFQRLTIQPPPANLIVTDMTMDPGNSNLVLVHVFDPAVTQGGVWASPSTVWSGTGTWTHTLTESSDNGKFAANHSGAPASSTFYLALDETPSTAPCAGSHGTLRKSPDGTSWTELTAARGFCGGQCFYDMPVAVDPTNANIVYIGGSAGSFGSCNPGTLAKSIDGGTTFNPAQASLHADSHATAIFPGNTSIVYAGNDGGIFRSADGGGTWTSRNTAGFNATQFESISVHPTDPNFTIGGTQDNGTPFRHPDGSWTRADFGDGGFSAIDQNAPDTTNVTMYHTYFNVSNDLVGFAQVTGVANAFDGNWNFFGCQGTVSNNGIGCGDSVLFYAPMALGPGNPNTVYFGTDTLYRSANQGSTMTAASQAHLDSEPISAIGISPQDDNVRIVGLMDGHVFATSTGATTLTDVTGGWILKYIARAVIDPNNKATAYITLDGYGATTGHIWKTTNLNAATPVWVSVSSGLPDVPVNGLIIDPLNSNLLYAGTDIGVFNSTDDGATWNPYGSGLPRVAVFDLKITAGRKVRVATHGRGMWETDAVGALSTTTAITGNSNTTFGTPITLTATINTGASAVSPTGSVDFIESSAVFATVAVGPSGTASAQTPSNFAVGTHNITARYSGDVTYLGTTSAAFALNVTNAPNADYSLNIPSGTATVKAGQPAQYTINLATQNGFAGTVNFSCSGLPSLASCTFNPASVSVNGNSGSTVLNISTTAPTAAAPGGNLNSGLLRSGGLFALGLVLAGGIVMRKRRTHALLLLIALLALMTLAISCGNKTTTTHNPGTPTGTSQVTITATSGSTTHTATVTLTVQ